MRRIEIIGRWTRTSATLVLVGALVACSGASPTSPTNPGAGTGPGTTPPPTPPPPPTSNTIDILRSQGGDASVSGRNGIFAAAAAAYDVRGRSAGGFPGRSYAEAAVSMGIGERPVAKSWVYYDWDSAPGNYRVSTDVRWRGHLASNGIAGSGAKMTYELEIRDFRGRLVASRTLHQREIREAAVNLGGLTDEGSTSATLDFTLPANTGGPFRILLILTCETYSGAIGSLNYCLYGNSTSIGPANLTGYAEWTALSVTTFR